MSVHLFAALVLITTAVQVSALTGFADERFTEASGVPSAGNAQATGQGTGQTDAAVPVTPTAKPSVKAKAKSSKSAKPKPLTVHEKSDLPPLLREVEAKYATSPSMMAKFHQDIHAVATGVTKKSAGVVMFKRPDKFRWEILSPDSSISVSNGKQLWHYTPPFDEGDQGHVIIRPAGQAQTKLASALLSGSFSGLKGMRIQPAGENLFTLIPKSGTAGGVKKATIEIDPKTKLIRRVMLDEQGGNRSEIALSEIQIGKALPEAVFNFTPPPNTVHDDE